MFGMFACGCRTIIVIAGMSFMVYYTLTRGIRKSLLFYIACIRLFVLILAPYPSFAEKLDFCLAIVNDKSNVSGSSDLNMRSGQLAAVLYYIKDDFLYGLGKDYFYIDMDWESGRSIDKELFGLEGVYLNLLLERGILGLMFYTIFWIVLLIKIFISRKKDLFATAFGLAVISAYLVFAIMTGELNSAFLALLLCGYVMAEIYKAEGQKITACVPQKSQK